MIDIQIVTQILSESIVREIPIVDLNRLRHSNMNVGSIIDHQTGTKILYFALVITQIKVTIYRYIIREGMMIAI